MKMKLTRSQKPGELFPLPEARCALPKGPLGPMLFVCPTNEPNMTRQIGEVEKMKDRPSVFRMALAAGMATAVYLVASGSVASAQTAPAPNGSATRPPAASAAQAPALPRGVSEVLKMYQAGIDKNIIVNYVDSTALPYHLNADGIIYLQTLGLPQEITKAMILRDGQLQQERQAAPQYNPQQPMPGNMPPPYGAMPGQPPVQVVAPTTPAPPVADYGDYTDYGYTYPNYYGYPYYYGGPYYGYGYGWPAVAGGWGWGRGWGRGWGYGGFRGGVGGGFRGGVGGFHGGGGFGGFHAGGGFHGGGVGHASGGGGHGGGHR
jgi:hypothetical protein